MLDKKQDEIREKIRKHNASIQDLKKYLPYADHGAYGQDLERIKWHERQVYKLWLEHDEIEKYLRESV